MIYSTKSPTLEFLPANRSLRAGASPSPRGHRCARRSAPIIRRCSAHSSTGGIPGCQVFKPALQRNRRTPSGLGSHPGERRNRIHIARGSRFGSGNDELRLGHAVAAMDVDLAAPQLDLFIPLAPNAASVSAGGAWSRNTAKVRLRAGTHGVLRVIPALSVYLRGLPTSDELFARDGWLIPSSATARP